MSAPLLASFKRLASGVLPGFALFTLAVAAPSCKKASEPGAEAPGGAATADGGATPASDEITLRYRLDRAKLRETGKFSLDLAGMQSGRLNIDVVGTLDITAVGDQLKVAYTVDEVRDATFGGVLAPKPEDAEDPKAALLASRGARLVDLRGETDSDASKALPENAKPEGEKGGGVAESIGEFLGLPELPELSLKVGTPVTREKETEEDLGGLKIPIDEESTYTLVKIDESSGKRLAEVHIEKEGSGAIDMPQGGGGMLSIDQISEMKLIFNLDDQLPVSFHVEQTTSFAAGSQGGGETRVIIDATFEPLS